MMHEHGVGGLSFLFIAQTSQCTVASNWRVLRVRGLILSIVPRHLKMRGVLEASWTPLPIRVTDLRRYANAPNHKATHQASILEMTVEF